jgi:hypothetical protein
MQTYTAFVMPLTAIYVDGFAHLTLQLEWPLK